MNEPALLWPWPWWTAVAAALTAILIAWAAQTVAVSRRNARIVALNPTLRQLGLYADGSEFSVAGDKNAIAVGSEILATVDMRDTRVVHSTAFRDTVGLKIYESNSVTIGFRILLKNGAESRRIETRSVVDFARLFARMTNSGKRIEYIQE